ncbi:MAG TPA: hypothetical protein VHF89_08065 [Solirubrobacteraceae bacterium]|nr:hypothetical protein [Solirubrobacteraceae bacterium]
MTLLDEALAAHGGAGALDDAELVVELRGGGFAFTSHGLPAQWALRAHVGDPHRPRVEFRDFLRSGRDARFEPERVVVGERARDHPRRRLGTKHPRWDHLDMAYFCGYALWNYVTTPWLLRRADVRELPGRRLRARFPPEVPTHSPVQTFHFGPDGLLTRLDYTALVFGRWARAAHRCYDHERFGPIVAPTRRLVTPRAAGRPLPGPKLVWLHVVDVAVNRSAQGPGSTASAWAR